MTVRRSALALAVCVLPAVAAACPACFGADEDSQKLAAVYNASIGVLLGVTFGLMVAGGLWFRRLELRRQAEWNTDPSTPSRPD